MFTRYNCLTDDFWKAQTNFFKRTSYYHIEMVEPYKYTNNVEKFERQLTVK